MDIKDLLNLVNAGFTAEMIAAFAHSASKPKPEPKPKPKPEPANELSEIKNRLDELTKAVQTNNAVAATAPTLKENDVNDVNDVILNLIKEV